MSPLAPVLRIVKSPKALLGMLGTAMVVLLWFLWDQNKALNREIGRLETGVAQAKLVNDRTVDAFRELKIASDVCNAQWARITKENEIIVERFNDTSNALQQQHAERLRALERVFNETSCRTLGGISISAACPAAAHSLRQSASRVDGGEN